MSGKVRKEPKHHLVIVGGGFGGLACARAAQHESVRVTVVDRRSHQEFQPLLFQVATGALSPDAVRYPLREALPRHVRFEHDAVLGVDPVARVLRLGRGELRYDSLVLAAGSFVEVPKLFPEALPLKDLADALTLRDHLFEQLALAYDQHDPSAAVFVIVGGGPTGVELAGEIRRLADEELESCSIVPRVVLVEQTDRLLPGFSRRASIAAERYLDRIGVEVRLETTLDSDHPHRYELRGPHGQHRIEARTLVWAAGVRPTVLNPLLGPTDDVGRAIVDNKCRVMDQPGVYAIGDAARFEANEGVLPWTAQVAMQQGAYVGHSIVRYQRRRRVHPFEFFDRGMIAHVGYLAAVGNVLGMPVEGALPWLLGELVHLAYLPGLENRVLAASDFVATNLGRRRRPSITTAGASRRFDAPTLGSTAEPPTIH